MKSLTALALAALLILAIGAPLPLRAASAAAPCSFARGNPIAPTSSWVEQFKCYQSTGRHVSVAGSSGFDAGSVSGGVCVVGVATDRVQVAPCGSLSGDTAMTIAFSAIAYVVDDPKADAVSIYVSALLRH